jgi:hypothetical protein
MIINHRHRIIFFHVPKAAGSSIRKALLSQPGSLRPPRTGKHITPAEFAKTLRGKFDLRWRYYFSFCFVRNPWERFGSLHRFLLRNEHANFRLRKKHANFSMPPDLNDFALALEDRLPWIVELHSIRPQSDYTRGIAFIGRFERLEQDYALIANRLELPSVALRHFNASGDEIRYRDKMNTKSEAIIADYYRDDIQRLGYC